MSFKSHLEYIIQEKEGPKRDRTVFHFGTSPKQSGFSRQRRRLDAERSPPGPKPKRPSASHVAANRQSRAGFVGIVESWTSRRTKAPPAADCSGAQNALQKKRDLAHARLLSLRARVAFSLSQGGADVFDGAAIFHRDKAQCLLVGTCRRYPRPSSAAASSRCAAIRVTLIQPGGAGGVPPRGQVQHQRPPQQPLELQPPPLRVPQSHRVFGTAGRPF